jgi:uncharacterized protein
MTSPLRIVLVSCALLLSACATTAVEPPRVLIFTHSTGFRHASIEPAVAALQALGAREGYVMETSADPDVFSAEGLGEYDAIILVSNGTTRDPASEWLVGARRNALQNFVHDGRGVVAIHAAAAGHYHWPWYRQMIGASFERHPAGTPTGRIAIVDHDHPATRNLPPHAERTDEWYYFVDYDPTVRVLVTADPASIGADDSNPNPISWAHEFEGGRIFYTAMGHTAENYSEPLLLDHLRGGLRWALRLED